MRPRYNYGSPPQQDEQQQQQPQQQQQSREPRPSLTIESNRSWKKYDSFRQASSFNGGSTSPVSSISADLGPFLSPVPGHGVQGFRASTPRQQQRPESASSQSYIDQSSIPSPDQSYAIWAAKEDSYSRERTSNLSNEKENQSEISEYSRSGASSWSFAEAASINHPSVQGLSNSRPQSRYFSSSDSESNDQALDDANNLNEKAAVAAAGDEDEDEDHVIPETLLTRQHISSVSNGDGRSEKSLGSHQNFLSSDFEQPNTRLWQKRGSANTSLISQRLDRYRRDSLNKIDRIGPSSEYDRQVSNSQIGSRSGSLDRARNRQTESRQSDISLKSRSRLRETWRASRQSEHASKNLDHEDDNDLQGLQRLDIQDTGGDLRMNVSSDNEYSNIQSQSGSHAGSGRIAAAKNREPKHITSHVLSPSRERAQAKAKYLRSNDLSPDLHGDNERWSTRKSSLSNGQQQAKQTQVKAIGKTLAKLEKLLDEDESIVEEIDFEKTQGKRTPPPNNVKKSSRWVSERYDDTASVTGDGSSKSQQLLSRIWQLQMSLDLKETELLDARRHSRWLEEQLHSARQRIDKLEHDTESRHQLQERLYKTEEAANEANHRVTDLLQINFKLVNDHELLMMRQVGGHQAVVNHAVTHGREAPWISSSYKGIHQPPPFSRSSTTGDCTNMRMAELQNRLRKLWDDSRQLEDYMKERSSSRLSVTSPIMDGRVRPRNPSPRLLTQRMNNEDEVIQQYQDTSDEDDDTASVTNNLADLVKLLKSESELHRHQLVKTVQLLAANVNGGDPLNEDSIDRTLPHGLTTLAQKIQMMERRYEEREKQLNRIIGINRQKNKQSLLHWKKRWENRFDEWPAAVEPLLTQLESQEEDDDEDQEEDDQLDDEDELVVDDNK